MDQSDRGRTCATTQRMRAILGTRLVLAAVLALSGCGQDSGPAPAAIPAESYGRIDITYPLDETLFPPDIAAPTFVWVDEADNAEQWKV
jgi:hypothetical protein